MERSAFGRSGVPMVSCHLQNACSLSLSLLLMGFFLACTVASLYSAVSLCMWLWQLLLTNLCVFTIVNQLLTEVL